MGFSGSRENLRSTRKETRSSSGGENWSRCGTIGRSIDGNSSFIGQLPAMKRRRVILLKGHSRSKVLLSDFTERMSRIDMKWAALTQTYCGQ